MGWKNWTYQGKGALIGFLLAVIVMIILFVSGLGFDIGPPYSAGIAVLIIFFAIPVLIGTVIGRFIDRFQK